MDSSSGSSNDAQESAILNFQEICATEARHEALLYLQRYNWDIQAAVQEYLADRDDFSSERPSIERSQNQQNFLQQQEINAASNNPGPSRSNIARNRSNNMSRRDQPMGWIQWTCQLVNLPFRFFFVTLYDIWTFIYRSFFAYDRAITNPADDVDKFIAQYEIKYGLEHPTFYRGSYSQALNDAKRELKFLCVYLHCDTHQDTNKFCTTTLKNRTVIDFLNTRTLMWGCSVKLREGYRVSQAMHETTYPFLALICLRENRMMVVVRQEGNLEAEDFLQLLNTAMTDNEIYLNLARQERDSQRQNQVLREQQEQAFQESLQSDQEKERQRLGAELLAKQRVDDEQRQRRFVAEMRSQLAQERVVRCRALPLEPSATDLGVVRVSLKFPSGARLERRFFVADSLQILFDVTMCHADCPENFSIYSGFPRQLLLSAQLLQAKPCAFQPQLNFATFQAAELSTSALLMVQDDSA